MLMSREGANVSSTKMLIAKKEHRKRASSKIKCHHSCQFTQRTTPLYKQNVYTYICTDVLWYAHKQKLK